MDEPRASFRQLFSPEVLLEQALGWAPRLVAGLVILLIGWAVARALSRLLTAVFHRVELDPTAAQFVLTVVRFAVGLIALLAALDQVGIDTTSILTSLGVMGLTLGFAAQNTLSNVISGLFIFWDRPFVIGDLVEVGTLYGRVETITLRSTRVVTPDGKMVAIPNQIIANSQVVSYTNFPHLRIDIPVTVGVESDLSKVRRILLSLVQDDPDYMTEPAPVTVVRALNDYNVEVELHAWLHDEKRHIRKRFELREKIFEAFTAEGVDMPYETLQLRPLQVATTSA